ncbi:LamG-like jellyroll fold domain-containing protein [Streptacidiphilus sp. P02-A3a]|uniref:LamG-like jellyroll fold domain-containing protein n=1 Tax=Streptacidiphilus sp. P02-A3a TaxID=2704468 RepID=UPI0015FBB3C3|nr:LamG-like jellyroll fold domain-containing protein [Streptacidiphilus sp. P02-A3a]QMU68286.1 hypothetical protein GXP74_08650 [Streptacidiphilus sp. P02-A3a]
MATTDTVVLSGGGRGPVAEMYTGGQGFSLRLPVTLPRPTLSGASARYADVLPGVDLTLTVLADGAVSDVFTVRTRVAAHNPHLPGLLDATVTTTRGLRLATDRTGDLSVADAHGHPLYTAPAPHAWDSTATALPGGATTHTRNAALAPSDSSADAPAHGAHIATLAATTHATSAETGAIDLAAPTALLNAPGTVYPVYVDPTYSPTYGISGWSSPGSGVPSENYWNSTVDSVDTPLLSEVGNSSSVQDEAMSLFDFSVPYSALHGAKIYGVSFGITETYSWACPTSGHDQAVDLYAPAQVLTSSNANWNAWSGSLGSTVASDSFALGYNSSCPAGATPAFSSSALTTDITNDIANSTHTQTLALRADDHSDNYAFKKFDPTSAELVITFDKHPNAPSGLKTIPASSCAGSVLGDTSVTLYATQSTPTRSSLTTTFNLYKSSDSAKNNLLTSANGISSDTWTGASGQQAVLTLSESFFSKQAGGVATSFSFIAESTDTTLTSGWTATACTFKWDPTRPGAPIVKTNASPPPGAKSCLTLDGTVGSIEPIGSTCGFTLSPLTTGGTSTPISGYLYQTNQAAPIQLPATGSASITVPLTNLVNTLTVSALSAGGNIGSATTVWFDGAGLNPPANDGDLNLDGVPDLIVPGGTGTEFGHGLWMAAGTGNGGISTHPVNIGVTGLGTDYQGKPTDWDGAQAITGDFCGNGAQDVFAYFPTGANAGGGDVACNDGSAGPLHGANLNSDTAPSVILPGALIDDNNDNVTDVVTAGNTSGEDTGLPDLLATGPDGNLYLYYSTTSNGYSNPFSCVGTCDVLTGLRSPDGTSWNNWTLATAQLSSGTAMYLWNRGTGALDLWTGLAVDNTGTTLTTTGQYTITDGVSTFWNKDAADPIVLRAADMTGSGVPDLWATDTMSGVTSSYMPSTLSASMPVPTSGGSKPPSADHAWSFEDIGANISGTPITSTADSFGTLPLTGAAGAVWNKGDTFSPDVLLNTDNDGVTPTTGGTGDLSTTANAVDLTNSFTVSAWVDPAAYSAAVLTQDGNADSGLSVAVQNGTWSFSLNTGAGTAWTLDTITGGTAQLNTWAHLTATYNQGSGVMNLYVDNVFVASGRHAALSSGATGPFRIGDDFRAGKHQDYFSGRVADVQTLAGTAVPPTQVSGLASYHQAVTPTRILDTRAHGTMIAYAGTTASSAVAVGASTVQGGTTTILQIADDPVTPATSGAPDAIPSSITAVAVDLTATGETGAAYLSAYADGTEQPQTSSTDFSANDTVTSYQIVPVGSDGRIDLTLGSSGFTTALIVDVTGYYTSDSTLIGDQTYSPLPSATRLLDTRTSTNYTNLTSSQYNSTSGVVADGTSFTLAVGGNDGIPANASAVAVDLTAVNQSGTGFLEAYATGATPTTGYTSLSFDTSSASTSMAADVPIGANGSITISVHGAAAVIADIAGYFTTGTSSQKYHTVNPTRLVDTRSGIGGTQGSVAAFGTYTLTAADTQLITTATVPTLAATLTVTDASGDSGNSTVYPTAAGLPVTANVNWAPGSTRANLTLTPTDANGKISIYNHSSGTVDFVLDCSGYFD